MSFTLRIILIIASILTTTYVLRKIRKSQMQIEDTLFWLGGSILLVVISVFPKLVTWGANATGVASEVNFVFLSIIFVLLIKLFSLSIKVSQVENKLKTLIQEFSLSKTQSMNKIDNRTFICEDITIKKQPITK